MSKSNDTITSTAPHTTAPQALASRRRPSTTSTVDWPSMTSKINMINFRVNNLSCISKKSKATTSRNNSCKLPWPSSSNQILKNTASNSFKGQKSTIIRAQINLLSSQCLRVTWSNQIKSYGWVTAAVIAWLPVTPQMTFKHSKQHSITARATPWCPKMCTRAHSTPINWRKGNRWRSQSYLFSSWGMLNRTRWLTRTWPWRLRACLWTRTWSSSIQKVLRWTMIRNLSRRKWKIGCINITEAGMDITTTWKLHLCNSYHRILRIPKLKGLTPKGKWAKERS